MFVIICNTLEVIRPTGSSSQPVSAASLLRSVYFRNWAAGALVSTWLLSGLAELVTQLAKLTELSNHWVEIYFTFLSSVHFHPVSRSVRLSFQLGIFGKGPFLKLEKCCGHFWSFSLDWPPYPRLSLPLPLFGPNSTKLMNWHVPCPKMEKNFRFALGELETKEHLNRRSRNRTETLV